MVAAFDSVRDELVADRGLGYRQVASEGQYTAETANQRRHPMTESTRPTCETCRYVGWTGTQFYDCRRHAPIARDEENRLGGVIERHWPMVESRDWCGDHEPKP
jgi:hypothetical protein